MVIFRRVPYINEFFHGNIRRVPCYCYINELVLAFSDQVSSEMDKNGRL